MHIGIRASLTKQFCAAHGPYRKSHFTLDHDNWLVAFCRYVGKDGVVGDDRKYGTRGSGRKASCLTSRDGERIADRVLATAMSIQNGETAIDGTCTPEFVHLIQ